MFLILDIRITGLKIIVYEGDKFKELLNHIKMENRIIKMKINKRLEISYQLFNYLELMVDIGECIKDI